MDCARVRPLAPVRRPGSTRHSERWKVRYFTSRGEWVIAVVGAHYAGALIAHDLGDSGPDQDRRFAFTLTHDYVTVLAAARSLMDRVSTASSFPGAQRTDLPTPVATTSR
jgi:hypothetical protein